MSRKNESTRPKSFKLNTDVPEVVAYTQALPPFDGISFSVQCFENNGHRNFRILTQTIEANEVTHTEYSDPYAIWEAIARLELHIANACLSLNGKWMDKKGLCK